MVRKKKQSQPEKSRTVKCPIKGHNHELPLIPSPDRPDLLIARCGERDVYQTSAYPPRPSEPAIVNYVVPHYED